VRDLGELTAQERAEIELEENIRRKDLTDLERSKHMVERGQRLAVAAREHKLLCPITSSL
jgi:hypothetical protein